MRWDALWFLLWAVGSSAWCVSAARELSATFDEPTYVARGLERWRAGSYAGVLRLGTMPLPADVQTLPLYAWERARGTPFDAKKDFSVILPVARAATLVFWWLLLLYGMLIARGLAGPWGGRLAVAALACEPSLLAHAGLATTDVAVTACLLALAYHFWRGRGGGWFTRVFVPMLWYAAAVLAKASALTFAPICLLVIEIDRLRRQPPASAVGDHKRRWSFAALAPFGRDLVWIIGGGLFLVFVYCGSDWLAEPSFVQWAQSLPEGPWRSSLTWLAEHLRIFSNAGNAIARQIRHNIQGHGVYVLGHTDPRALWYYFPVVLSIKLSEPLLLGTVLLAVIRPRTLANWSFTAAAVLIVLSVTMRVQIGVRMVLPIVALAAVGVSAAAIESVRSLRPRPAALMIAAMCGALAWSGAAALSIWPNGITYINRFWGGTPTGYLYVSDADYDWGQGLKELDQWQRASGVDDLDVWYFGTDPMLERMHVRPQPLHDQPISQAADVLQYVRGRHLAASTTLVYGNARAEAHRRAAAFLRARQPSARTTTFLVYDFSSDDAAH